MKKMNLKEKGITLIALVVTIIILLILAGVAIASVTGDNGLFRRAREAVNTYKDSERVEQGSLIGLENEISKELGGGNGEETKTPVDPTPSYVGYYADIEGDGIVDGIIFADQAKGNTRSGQWTDGAGVYTIPTITGTKSYYVKEKDYSGPFGTKDVLSPTGEGLDRFYVMKLVDFTNTNGSTFCWYDAAYGNMNDYSSYTSGNFGAGKKNTADMITKWDAEGYGAKDNNETYKDLWGQIQEEVAKGWFVPSRGEWAAFAEELGITSANYTEKGLNDWYWSSSQNSTYDAYGANFDNGYINFNGVNGRNRVRLSVTF